MAIPLFLLVFVGSAVLFQPSLGFEWKSSSPDDGANITACIGDKVTFPWEYTVGEDEVVLSTEWHKITDEETVLATRTSGTFFKSPHLKMNVQFLPNAGIQISNYTWADYATYRVTVKYIQNIVFHSSSRTVILALPDVPVIAGDRLVVHVRPEPVLDTDTGDRHVQLTCGQFLSLGSMGPESVVWRTPSDTKVPSTSYSNGRFLLTLPNPVVGGSYHCYLKDPSQAARCAKSVKAMLALKRGAHIQLDEVKARMLLLGGEVKGLQVKDVQKDAELKRQREVDSSLRILVEKTDETILSNVNSLQEILLLQEKTDETLSSDVDDIQKILAQHEKADQAMSSNMAELHKDLTLQEKEIREEVSSEVDQLRSELSKQNSVIAELKETEQNLQSTIQTLKDDVQKYKEHDTEIRIDIAKIKEQLNTATKSVSFHAQLNYGPYKAGDTLTAYRTFNNDGNAYSETSGVFTVPVSGTYIFLANVMVQAGSSRNINDGVFIYVDGKDHGRCWSSYKDHYNQGSCHAIVKLRAGQRVWLYNRNDDSRYYYDSTTFSGALLHAGLS